MKHEEAKERSSLFIKVNGPAGVTRLALTLMKHEEGHRKEKFLSTLMKH